MTVSALLLFFPVPWIGLQCEIEVFPDHTHFLPFHNFSSESLQLCKPDSRVPRR